MAKPPSARTFELYDDASDGEEAPPLPRPEVPEEGEILSYSAFLAKLALPASSQLAERVGNFIHRAPSSVKIDQCSAPGQVYPCGANVMRECFARQDYSTRRFCFRTGAVGRRARGISLDVFPVLRRGGGLDGP